VLNPFPGKLINQVSFTSSLDERDYMIGGRGKLYFC